MYAIAKKNLVYTFTDRAINTTSKNVTINIRKGDRLPVVVFGHHARLKTKIKCQLKHGNVIFVATEGFRLDSFKIVKNSCIPAIWYKLLNSIKPITNG